MNRIFVANLSNFLLSALIIVFMVMTTEANAVGVSVSDKFPSQNLRAFAGGPSNLIDVNKTYSPRAPQLVLTQQLERPTLDLYPLNLNERIVGLGVTGTVVLNGPHSLVRIVLIDKRSTEYLVYEGYPLITPVSESVQLDRVCRETCILPNIRPKAIRIETINANVEIKNFDVNGMPLEPSQPAERAAKMAEIKTAQENEIVNALNEHIKIHALKWRAGETSISRLSFNKKRKLFPCALMDQSTPPETVPNLQGFEYYRGGIFEVPSITGLQSPTQSTASEFVDTFDWRSRHGANNPKSPYFDGDNSGSGWLTSIKSQQCADCWAHCVNGAVEAGVNLFFNDHLDLDLSEQELVSCAGAGGCSGGSPSGACQYVRDYGVADELCFPETGRDDPCSNKCSSPTDQIRITDYEGAGTEPEELKQRLIENGPLTFGIISWWHCLVLVGYETEIPSGEPVWILKNSWGADWGENGYARLKVSPSDTYLTNNLVLPINSLINFYNIACRDEDHDGYYNWGISSVKPEACAKIPSVNDCNDWDPHVALEKADGSCVPVCKLIVSRLQAKPSLLWPPNHRMVPVQLMPYFSKTCGSKPVCKITSVKSNEPAKSDWKITGNMRLNLRAERAGSGKGRVYTITVNCTDTSGTSTRTSTKVIVPHNIHKKK